MSQINKKRGRGGGEDPDKPSVLPPEIPEKVVEAPIKIQTKVDTKKKKMMIKWT